LTTYDALLAFSLAAGLLTITPGMDTALVLRTAAVEGSRRAMLAAVGICCGLLTWGLAASVGLGALLAASQVAYRALRMAGACYLIFLGTRMVLRKHKSASAMPDSASPQVPANHMSASAPRWFVRGLLANLLNPKVGVFYVTFLPQFIPAGVAVIWFSLLILATRPLSRWLRRPRVVQTLDRATGTVLVGFGFGLALDDRR
jgi:threonine/homoserine/homoserine lactone efflux protein